MYNTREVIAKRVARFFRHGDLVNLGIGLPTLVANYIPDNVAVILQSENGYIGMGPNPQDHEIDKDIVNAGGQFATIVSGGSCFDSALSFSIIRGGHLAATVLGALEVDEKGNLANWMVPGKMVPGMGGAMDLVVGARKVIIAMEHTTKDGNPKILKNCRLPLTAINEVDYIVTELGMMEITPKGIILRELVPGVELKEIINKTEADLLIDENLCSME